MSRIPFAFYLSADLVPVAEAIARGLEDRVGVEVDFAADATDADRRALLDGGAPGITWLCGLETLERQADGRLDATITAAPVFPGQPGPVYHAVVLVRAADPARTLRDVDGLTLAINEPGSWSGHHALRAALATEGLLDLRFGRVITTGSHAASIDALLAGTVDVAAIDHTVWDARQVHDPRTARLNVLARTRDWPAPPFSISGALAPDLARALGRALLELRPAGLDGIVPASDGDYEPLRAAFATSRSLPW